MTSFHIFITLHLIFVIIWFGYAPTEFCLRKKIKSVKGTASEITLLLSYLKLGNLTGMIGLIGVLITGILLSLSGPWGFFHSHWISTKQGIMILILINTFAFVIPTAVKISKPLRTNPDLMTDEMRKNLNKYGIAITIQNILILINILLGVFGATGLMQTI